VVEVDAEDDGAGLLLRLDEVEEEDGELELIDALSVVLLLMLVFVVWLLLTDAEPESEPLAATAVESVDVLLDG
jgi:hypothetical protein